MLAALAVIGYPVLSLVIKNVVVSLGLGVVFNLSEFDVGTLLAGLGIGDLAFAQAQDTLKNLFASLMLIADRSFRVGDLVQSIPNSDLTTAHVTNSGARRHGRVQTHSTVLFVTPSEHLIKFRDGIQLDKVSRPVQG